MAWAMGVPPGLEAVAQTGLATVVQRVESMAALPVAAWAAQPDLGVVAQPAQAAVVLLAHRDEWHYDVHPLKAPFCGGNTVQARKPCCPPFERLKPAYPQAQTPLQSLPDIRCHCR
jgi:hypothetical protein